MRRWTGIVGGLTAVLLLAGCGETDKSVAPAPVNPFEAARVGTDSTLEVMTWNIENFPKAGGATVKILWVLVVAGACGAMTYQEDGHGEQRIPRCLCGADWLSCPDCAVEARPSRRTTSPQPQA